MVFVLRVQILSPYCTSSKFSLKIENFIFVILSAEFKRVVFIRKRMVLDGLFKVIDVKDSGFRSVPQVKKAYLKNIKLIYTFMTEL